MGSTPLEIATQPAIPTYIYLLNVMYGIYDDQIELVLKCKLCTRICHEKCFNDNVLTILCRNCAFIESSPPKSMNRFRQPKWALSIYLQGAFNENFARAHNDMVESNKEMKLKLKEKQRNGVINDITVTSDSGRPYTSCNVQHFTHHTALSRHEFLAQSILNCVGIGCRYAWREGWRNPYVA